MTRSKKIFLLLALIFLILLAIIVWDFSRKTEFKRHKPQPEQQTPSTVQLKEHE